MFIGHFAIAYIFYDLFPAVPPLVLLLGVSFPDLLWPVLILTGVEKAEVDPESPLQKNLKFTYYPYSHSFLGAVATACIPGAILALVLSPAAGIVFVLASASHWLLDTVMHIRDLPLSGTARSKKIGLGLWNRPILAFAAEYVFYAIVTVLVLPPEQSLPLLVIGALFHLINANSFFGFTKKNPFRTPRAYALVTLAGFLAFSLIANVVLSG